MVPSSVRELAIKGHEVFVETNAGTGIGFQIKIILMLAPHPAGTAAEVC